VNAPAPAPAPSPPPPQQFPPQIPPGGGYPPPPGHAAPPGYGAPMGAQPQPRPPGGKSKTPILIAIVALVLAGGGVAAFLLLRGGGDGGGSGSPDALIKGTLAALSAGDIDGLVKMSDPKGLRGTIECKSEEAKEEMDPDKQIRKIKREYEELVDSTKGMKIELVSSKKGDVGKTFEKGEEVEDTCKANVKIQMVTYALKLKLEKDGQTGEQDVDIEMLDAGGRFFLMEPPVVKIGPNYKAILEKMKDYKEKMCACKDTACSEKVDKEFMSWTKEMSAQMEDEKPDDEMMDKFMPVMTAYMECQSKLSSDYGGGYTPPPPPPVPAPSGLNTTTLVEAPSDMPDECRNLRAVIAKLATCDGYYGKDGVTASWNSIVDSWNQLPAGSRTGMGAACESAADSFKQAAPAGCL
jgi:hypothetical protein